MNTWIIRFVACVLCVVVDIGVGNARITKSSIQKRNGIILATWNIGHFAQGKTDHSLISVSNYQEKLKQYRTFVYDSIKADVLCINEFSSDFCRDKFGKGIFAEKCLFDEYRYRKVFKQNRFVCNSLFANIRLKSAKMFSFRYNEIAKIDRPSIMWHYYVVADINIDGENVKLICTHLVNRAEKHCQRQISELIDVCNKYEKVIICGDVNTWDFSKFKKAGYKLANDGTIVTFPSKSYALDNIFVKGLKISEVCVHKTNLSDHYSLSCHVSL